MSKGNPAMIEILPSFELIGLKLPHKTRNQDGQSNRDGGQLWQKFEQEQIASQIPQKFNEDIYAVYFDYEGDHSDPFSYFVGCRVAPGSTLPDGLDRLIIPAQTYQKLKAEGPMPDCIAELWKEIWKSDLPRAYIVDFEIYGEKSKNWNHAEIDVFLSITT
ncbi:GyrI-like domain-containing protein [Algoriphagus hitonicola]|uniref:Predicted transcriptional regulator YdeE, contains AraC-type DNA-binding domain n=1 Tax=Algoriphagus hitonicola TaxID=435880 RepID=A0A1I2T7T4_9BACT|nr:GyrI-like domain-containing protein [Algoriphagus hitonicola]SFG60965.1 Predicted transcriptional regulator YdeE, contains AraC-type DNA-binding domain [Algoriphagus hitonicola]